MAVLFLIGEGKEEPEVITQLLGIYLIFHSFLRSEATLKRVFKKPKVTTRSLLLKSNFTITLNYVNGFIQETAKSALIVWYIDMRRVFFQKRNTPINFL